MSCYKVIIVPVDLYKNILRWSLYPLALLMLVNTLTDSVWCQPRLHAAQQDIIFWYCICFYDIKKNVYKHNSWFWMYSALMILCRLKFPCKPQVGVCGEEGLPGERGGHPDVSHHQAQRCHTDQQLRVWAPPLERGGLRHTPKCESAVSSSYLSVYLYASST